MIHGAADGAAHELIHWITALVLVVGGALFLAAAALQRFRPGWLSDRRRAAGAGMGRNLAPAEPVDRSVIRIVAGLSLGAAAIHLAAAPHHYAEMGDFGAGFLVAGIFQAAWARAALRACSPRTTWIGIAGNVGIVIAWIVSRSIGLPVGLEPWTPEVIGLPDGAATIFELLIVAGLTARLLGLDRALVARFAPVGSIAAIAVVPALGLVLLTSSLAAVAIAAGVDHGAVHVLPTAGSPGVVTGR